MIPLAIKQTTGFTGQDIDKLKQQTFVDYCDYMSKGDHLLLQLMLTNIALYHWALVQMQTGEKNYYAIVANRHIIIRKSAAKQLYIKSIRAFIYSRYYSRSIMTTLQKNAAVIYKQRQRYLNATQTILN